MTSKMNFYLKIFKALILERALELKHSFKDMIVNVVIWLGCTLVVLSFLFASQFNLGSSFAVFSAAGCLASVGIQQLFAPIFEIVADFENDKRIFFYLTLPMPSWMIFLKIAVTSALHYLAMAMLVIPIAKLLIWTKFDLTQVSWLKLILILVSTNLFYGTFTLWLVGAIRKTANFGNVWIRFVFPLWFFGGFQFSWHTMYKLSPKLGVFNLLNPVVYIMDGTRAALMGQDGYINVWICIVALFAFSFVCLWHSVLRLKKHLDYV